MWVPVYTRNRAFVLTKFYKQKLGGQAKFWRNIIASIARCALIMAKNWELSVTIRQKSIRWCHYWRTKKFEEFFNFSKPENTFCTILKWGNWVLCNEWHLRDSFSLWNHSKLCVQMPWPDDMYKRKNILSI